MSWHANQVYATPDEEVVSVFRRVPFLCDQLYLVDDLRGVRSEWTRDALFSASPSPAQRTQRHGLPPRGLLVVSPEIYRTGYDQKDPNDDFARHYCHNTPWPSSPASIKWADVTVPVDPELLVPAHLDPDELPLGLLSFLKQTHDQTSAPLVYYYCTMWGGDVEKEVAWVFDREQRIYELQDGGDVVEHSPAGSRRVRVEILRLGMKVLGVNLASHFFALHEASFHWRVYRMEPDA